MSNRLANVRIASPCSADWDKMQGTPRVRFCDSCRKNVYNISAMTAPEAEALIEATGARICMRFYRRSDGTILTEDCPAGLLAARKKMVRIATAAISSALSFASVAAAQVQQAVNPDSTVQTARQASGDLRGSVSDPTGAPIAKAVVICRNVASGQTFQTESDAAGQFQLKTLPKGDYAVSTESPGFDKCKKTVSVHPFVPARLDVKLQLGSVGEVIEVPKHKSWNPFSKPRLL